MGLFVRVSFGFENISSNSVRDTNCLHLYLCHFPFAACNYAKGKWVPDSKRPLYSGLGCKQWLSDMWACRLTQRTDFSYEGYRWQPEKCEMPDYEGSKFLKRYVSLSSSSISHILFQCKFLDSNQL